MPKIQTSCPYQTVVRICALVMMLACISVSGTAFAASNSQQAAKEAIQKNGGSGEVLGVSTETDGSGKRVFAVKIIKNGRVRVIRIPQS